jgi:ribose transport system substrate-binding protein
MSGYKVDGMSIGVSFGQNVHPFFKAMHKGIEDACKDYGIDKVSIQSADSALETQVTQIENLTSSGITSLLVNPYDSQGVAVAVQNAIDAGVSVFSMDISVDGAEPTYHISSDNVKIGELLAEHLDEMLGGKGKIAILVDPSVSSLKDRAQGFEDYIADMDIEIVAEQTGAVERTDALENAETILQAHSDIDAFIGINEATATGIASAIDAQGLSDKGIIVTGVDATEDVMNGIKNGTISFAVAQNPYQMGYMSVQNAIKVYNGEKVESVTQLACEIMDQSNVDYYVEREAQYND